MMPKASAIAGSLLAVCLDIHRQGLLQLAADMAQHTSGFKAFVLSHSGRDHYLDKLTVLILANSSN